MLFDIATGKRLATIGDENDAVLAADLSPDQTLLALGGSGKVVKVFSTNPAATVAGPHTPPRPAGKAYGKLPNGILSVAFAADGTLITCVRDRAVRLWNAGKQRKVFEPARHAAKPGGHQLRRPPRHRGRRRGRPALLGDRRRADFREVAAARAELNRDRPAAAFR